MKNKISVLFIFSFSLFCMLSFSISAKEIETITKCETYKSNNEEEKKKAKHNLTKMELLISS